ncbi:hypothetical protein [Planktothrix agardhii]|uniref:Uncharacterized protein n=1 Tax=Planktothrix agardhii (strain NIVA-CYA 126/8) TaxID=388467 RepID=A0A073CUW7_PLAA1|nr:hypothetical protein [Planktothrix agardhii]KEI67785.1 hypothetical protein A19Y_2936 [Planktothrix agardhii NIVA-CYA 126/8]CAD5946132.1 hypothetical protein NIVACYA_02692 [Planktothrix agardhii]
MVQTPNNTDIQLLSPTLHCYYYMLQNSLNDSPTSLKERRKIFSDNLNKLAENLKIKSGKNNDDLVKSIPLKPDILGSGSLLDSEAISPDYYKPNDDRLYINYGMFKNRLAVRCLNDTYFLRFTRYISNQDGVQSLKQFYHLREPISNLETQLGKTVILAGILPESVSSPTEIATACLNYYYNFPVEGEDSIQAKNLIENEFLGSKFYIYKKMVIAEQVKEYTVESIELVCVFLYANEETEKKADKVYQLLPELLLSYHKIHFFNSQSLILKKLLNQKYEILERQTEESHLTLDKLTLIRNLPQESLNYYKMLSFLEDQQRTISINSTNYDNIIKNIEQKIDNKKMPDFFVEAQKDFKFYSDQIESNINFLRPGIELYEKLMLSVQTEVSLDQATIQERQAKLGQLLTGSCAAIAIGQILNTPITLTVSKLLDKNSTQPSIHSLWLGSLLTILLSVLAGYTISKRVYQWFIKDKL